MPSRTRAELPPSLGFWPKLGSATAVPKSFLQLQGVLVRPWVIRGFRCIDQSPGILPRRRLHAPSRRRPFTPLGNGLLLLIMQNPLHGVMELLLGHKIIELDDVEGPSIPASKIKPKRSR